MCSAGTEVKVHVRAQFWIDYFNDLLKCWEPFLDPVSLVALLEQVVI